VSIHLLQYDIPEERVTGRSGRTYSRPVMNNPSARLWRAGAVRLTLSCWLIHDGAIPASLVNDFRRFGVRYETAPFDPSAGEALATMALNSIRREVAEYLQRARETAASESARLDDVEAGQEAATHKRYRSRMAAVTRRVREAISRVRTAAERFGISDDQLSIPDSLNSLSAIKIGMERRAEVYAKAHRLIEKKRGKEDAVAVSMGRDEMFGPVAADYLDEIGDDESRAVGAELRTAFGF
jgi:hypothetical protein